jgi:hypothetical protein
MIHDSTIVISISEKVRNTKSIGILPRVCMSLNFLHFDILLQNALFFAVISNLGGNVNWMILYKITFPPRLLKVN